MVDPNNTPSLAVASQALITLIYEAATRHGAWSQFLAAFAEIAPQR